jgi:predicted neuraminidase
MKYLQAGCAVLIFLIGARAFAQTEPDDEPKPSSTIPGRPGIIPQPSDAVLASEFIFRKAPFPSCHASTIVETKSGLVAAWFGGTRERAPDVCIWVSRNDGSKWSDPMMVADGVEPTGTRLPCWNPVLFRPKDGPLMLFYKIGPSPSTWWGMEITSDDDGVTWSKPKRLPDGIIGPSKDKPIQLSDGSILSPSSTENGGAKIHFESSIDQGKTWTAGDSLNDGKTVRLIQPTLLDHGSGVVQFLCRAHDNIFEGWSTDNGKTWSKPAAIELPNPYSGIDAVQLKDGRSLLVYNHSATKRSPLNIAISPDGKAWKPVIELENEDAQFSYPAVIQTSDGLVHIVYSWKRRSIAHAVVDPSKIN